MDLRKKWTIIHKSGMKHIIKLVDVYRFFGGINMTISDRIFEKLNEKNMSQKEFSEETGISQSTISEWKSKRTNPTSEKIMIICKVLDVTPEWLLSGIENTGSRGNNSNWYIVDKGTDMGRLLNIYHQMDTNQRNRLLGYMEALMSVVKN